MYKFRKKPVVIEAFRTSMLLHIETLEGTMTAMPGDWVITGVEGEQYPCKHSIFIQTYEPADWRAKKYFEDVNVIEQNGLAKA